MWARLNACLTLISTLKRSKFKPNVHLLGILKLQCLTALAITCYDAAVLTC